MATKCPDCHSAETVEDGERGETCCVGCGRVLADRIGVVSLGMSDTHTPVPLGERSTTMGVKLFGPAGDSASINRLRLRDRWISNNGRVSGLRTNPMRDMRSLHDKLGLPDSVLDRAAVIYAGLVKGGHSRGRHLVSLMAASLYVACREANVPRTLRDVAVAAGLPVKHLSKDIRFMVMGGMVSPRQYGLPQLIARISNDLGLGVACCREAIDTAGKLDRTYLAGKNPLAMAASLLYVLDRREVEGYTCTDLASASGISTVSIRNRAKELRGKI